MKVIKIVITFFWTKKHGLPLECPTRSCYHHKIFYKHVKGNLCINGQKSKSYEKDQKANSSYTKPPHPLIMWQCTPTNVELTTHPKATKNSSQHIQNSNKIKVEIIFPNMT